MIKLGLRLFVIASFLSGCVTGTRNIDLRVPEYKNSKSGSGQIYIDVINDNRLFEARPSRPSTPSVKSDLAKLSKDELSNLIGRQRNGFGRALGDVALPEGESIQQKVRELLTDGLEGRGYTVVDNEDAPTKVTVNIDKFWAWFSPGFAWLTYESEMQCKVDFEGELGAHSLNVKGYALNRGQVASNANWQLVYQRTFLKFLEHFDSVLDDEGL